MIVAAGGGSDVGWCSVRFGITGGAASVVGRKDEEEGWSEGNIIGAVIGSGDRIDEIVVLLVGEMVGDGGVKERSVSLRGLAG